MDKTDKKEDLKKANAQEQSGTECGAESGDGAAVCGAESYNFNVIGHYKGDLSQKFGVPRQSRLVDIPGEIHFSPEYWDRSAFKGLEQISHLWLIWVFSENKKSEKFQPTVRPPRLAGDRRIGVWASRSPNRPNQIGMSPVELRGFRWDKEQGPILEISGADLVDGTPILDIKPYIKYVDSIPEAESGFASDKPQAKLEVTWGKSVEDVFDENELDQLYSILAQDPRPAYQDDPERVYGMEFKGKNVKFQVVAGAAKITAVEEL